jgi:hypothetical protein
MFAIPAAEVAAPSPKEKVWMFPNAAALAATLALRLPKPPKFGATGEVGVCAREMGKCVD